MTSSQNPVGITAVPVSTDMDGVVTGVSVWLYGHETVLDREDSFALLDRLQNALTHQSR